MGGKRTNSFYTRSVAKQEANGLDIHFIMYAAIADSNGLHGVSMIRKLKFYAILNGLTLRIYQNARHELSRWPPS
jgi:hypothetical protein